MGWGLRTRGARSPEIRNPKAEGRKDGCRSLGDHVEQLQLAIVSNSRPANSKTFAIQEIVFQGEQVIQPLALVLYEKLLPGSQVVNRLQDLNYRVQAVSDTRLLVECAEQAKPMLVLVDLDANRNNLCGAISRLKTNPGTQHLPVIGFGAENAPDLQKAALAAGVTLIVSESAILNHLPQCLDQALRVE